MTLASILCGSYGHFLPHFISVWIAKLSYRVEITRLFTFLWKKDFKLNCNWKILVLVPENGKLIIITFKLDLIAYIALICSCYWFYCIYDLNLFWWHLLISALQSPSPRKFLLCTILRGVQLLWMKVRENSHTILWIFRT